jgi:predicted nuclease of predicted toxin-antitoxin system
MRLLIDMNLTPRWVRFLRHAGRVQRAGNPVHARKHQRQNRDGDDFHRNATLDSL